MSEVRQLDEAVLDVGGVVPSMTITAATTPRRGGGHVGEVTVRVLQAVVVLWATYTLTFFVLYLLPGDTVEMILTSEGFSGGQYGGIDEQAVDALRASYGLDKPVLVQYLTLLGHALTGDFGVSVTYNVPVTGLILDNLGPTLALAFSALALALVLGITLAFYASYVQQPFLRSFLTRVPALGVAMPGFFIGLLLLQVFSFRLGWFPSSGSGSLSQLVLPAVTMAIPTAALIAQVLIKSLDNVLAQAYITTARSKGLSERTVYIRHAFKNASFPGLTLIGMLVGATVTGAIITETVFSRQGVGRLIQQAVLRQDIPLVQGLVVLGASAFVVVSLVVDLVYPLLDPRLRRS